MLKRRLELEEYRDKIEHYGVTMEKMGMTPVASRIFIYLLLSPEQGATFDEMVTYFGVSKSAVSNALRTLEGIKMASSKTIGGQRKRYFFVNFNNLFDQENVTSKFKIFSKMLDDIKGIRGMEDDFAKEIDKVSKLYKMLIVEVPIIVERWRNIVKLDHKA